MGLTSCVWRILCSLISSQILNMTGAEANIALDPCVNACGGNTDCYLIGATPMCVCKPGFAGDAFDNCYLVSKLCSAGNHCQSTEDCMGGLCLDPCTTSCGPNTRCQVKQHKARCSCVEGSHWNPFQGCVRKDGGLVAESSHCQGPSKKAKKKFKVLSGMQVTWLQALKLCRSQNMYLASIESKEQMDDVMNEYNSELEQQRQQLYPQHQYAFSSIVPDRAWTSGFDMELSKKFVWLSSGSPVGYSVWLDKEPDGRNRCLSVRRDFKWAAFSCSYPGWAICEYY